MAVMAVVFAAAALVAVLVPMCLNHRIPRDREIADAMRLVGDAGERLLSAEDLPDSVALFVVRFSEFAARPRLARMLVLSILTGDFWKRLQASELQPSALTHDLDRLSSEQKRLFGGFVVAVTFSSAASDVLFSVVNRRLITWGLMTNARADIDAGDKAYTIALDMAPSMRGSMLGAAC